MIYSMFMLDFYVQTAPNIPNISFGASLKTPSTIMVNSQDLCYLCIQKIFDILRIINQRQIINLYKMKRDHNKKKDNYMDKCIERTEMIKLATLAQYESDQKKRLKTHKTHLKSQAMPTDDSVKLMREQPMKGFKKVPALKLVDHVDLQSPFKSSKCNKNQLKFATKMGIGMINKVHPYERVLGLNKKNPNQTLKKNHKKPPYPQRTRIADEQLFSRDRKNRCFGQTQQKHPNLNKNYGMKEFYSNPQEEEEAERSQHSTYTVERYGSKLYTKDNFGRLLLLPNSNIYLQKQKQQENEDYWAHQSQQQSIIPYKIQNDERSQEDDYHQTDKKFPDYQQFVRRKRIQNEIQIRKNEILRKLRQQQQYKRQQQSRNQSQVDFSALHQNSNLDDLISNNDGSSCLNGSSIVVSQDNIPFKIAYHQSQDDEIILNKSRSQDSGWKRRQVIQFSSKISMENSQIQRSYIESSQSNVSSRKSSEQLVEFDLARFREEFERQQLARLGPSIQVQAEQRSTIICAICISQIDMNQQKVSIFRDPLPEIQKIRVYEDIVRCEEDSEYMKVCMIYNTPRVLPCSHVFHNSCISKWFCQKGQCPNCRENVYAQIPAPQDMSIDMTFEEVSEGSSGMYEFNNEMEYDEIEQQYMNQIEHYEGQQHPVLGLQGWRYPDILRQYELHRQNQHLRIQPNEDPDSEQLADIIRQSNNNDNRSQRSNQTE